MQPQEGYHEQNNASRKRLTLFNILFSNSFCSGKTSSFRLAVALGRFPFSGTILMDMVLTEKCQKVHLVKDCALWFGAFRLVGREAFFYPCCMHSPFYTRRSLENLEGIALVCNQQK